MADVPSLGATIYPVHSHPVLIDGPTQDPTPFITGDPLANAMAFYASWGTRQLGLNGTAAAAFATIWGDFVKVPFIVAADSDLYLAGQLQVRRLRGADFDGYGLRQSPRSGKCV